MEKYVKTMVAVLLAVLGLGLTACSDDDDDGNVDSRLIVTDWVSVDGETGAVFKSNNTGYFYETDYPNDKENFVWEIIGNKLLVEYVNDNESAYFKIKKLTKNQLILSTEDGITVKFNTDNPVEVPDKEGDNEGDNNKEDEPSEPALPSHPDNYIKDKNSGRYYQITKVTAGCNHAGAGDNMNEKFLQFFGENGLLKPNGLRIYYYTPYYEGIDAIWRSGSYLMTGSGAYQYGAMGWINGWAFTSDSGDVLKITTYSGSTVYDYKGYEVELHVVVMKK